MLGSPTFDNVMAIEADATAAHHAPPSETCAGDQKERK